MVLRWADLVDVAAEVVPFLLHLLAGLLSGERFSSVAVVLVPPEDGPVMSRHVVARGLVVIAVLCLAWSAFVVLTPFAGEFWGVTLVVGVVAGIGAWRMLRTDRR